MYAMRERLRQRSARRQSLAGRSRGGYESRRIARPKWSGNDGRFDFLASPPRCSAACGACAAARAIGTPGGQPRTRATDRRPAPAAGLPGGSALRRCTGLSFQLRDALGQAPDRIGYTPGNALLSVSTCLRTDDSADSRHAWISSIPASTSCGCVTRPALTSERWVAR